MNTQRSSLLGLACFLCATSAFAQGYKIDWFTIDGGGGTSTGGAYSLSGTIGQPDAGTLSGGGFVLSGGFWPGALELEQLGVPTLHIVRSGSSAVISWEPNTPGFVLQEVGTVPSANWNFSGSGNQNPTTVSATTNRTRFYRLIKQ
jgi:hypothetical protein